MSHLFTRFEKAAGFLLLCFGACTASAHVHSANLNPNASVDELLDHYHSFQKITLKPAVIDPRLFALCIENPSTEMMEHRAAIGAPSSAAVDIYMNDSAADSFNKKEHYKTGAMIIKEKMLLPYKPEPGSPPLPLVDLNPVRGIGGMLKREPGYDPENGDWEYFYKNVNNPGTRGRLENCVQCHATAKDTDRVFGYWAPDPAK